MAALTRIGSAAVRLRALLFACLGLIVPDRSGALELVSDFGANPGGLAMYVHRPANLRPGLPLVVGLHGCRQTAADFDDETGLVALAEETPFVLLLPQQSGDNMALNCFRWYDPDDNLPGRGESASILAMIDDALGRYGADPSQVFVLGLSAGGAMTAAMLANHPDRFAGGAILAGVPYGCNRPSGPFDWFWYSLNWSPFALDGADASYACGIRGFSASDRAAAEWGGFVRDAAGTIPDTWPVVSIWQGTADDTVDPDNLAELVEQWTDVHGIDAIADAHETVGGGTHTTYRDADGNPRVEAWSLEGFPHAVPIDADGVADACGVTADYIVDADLCAVRRIAAFWRLGSLP